MNAEYVLGNMIKFQLNDHRLVEGLSTIKPDFFTNQRHAQVFGAIKSCFEQGLTPDPITISDQLANIKLEQYESWLEIITKLAFNAPSSANFKHSLANLKAEYSARHANSLLNQAIEALNDVSNPNVQDRIKNAAQSVSEIEYEDIDNKSWFGIADTIADIFDDMIKASQQGSALSGITTGFEKLDDQIDGLQNGETYVLAGSPGSGKTTFAINTCVANLLDDKKVLFYSLEMPHKQIGKKLMSCAGNIPSWVLKNDKYVKGQNKMGLDVAFSQVAGRSFIIDEGYGLTAENLDITTKKHQMRLGGIDIIFVDYLTLMDAKGETETVKASNAAKACKRLAKRFDCPVVILAQLVKNIVGKPKKSDLKQTGQLEQDAASIFLLYNDPDNVDPCIEMEVAKNRFGETGDAYFNINFESNKFMERDHPPTKTAKQNEKREVSVRDWRQKNAN